MKHAGHGGRDLAHVDHPEILMLTDRRPHCEERRVHVWVIRRIPVCATARRRRQQRPIHAGTRVKTRFEQHKKCGTRKPAAQARLFAGQDAIDAVGRIARERT